MVTLTLNRLVKSESIEKIRWVCNSIFYKSLQKNINELSAVFLHL